MKFVHVPKVRIAFLVFSTLFIASQIAHANIVGYDDRQEIEQLPLSSVERAAMYQIVGLVECRRGEDRIGRATGIVIDGGRNLLTVAHFIKEGSRQCTFTRRQFQQPIPFELENATVGTTVPDIFAEDDWAIVPLKSKLTAPVFRLGTAPRQGEELLVVGVVSRGKELDKSKLIGRRCTAVDVFSRSVFNDCDTLPGDSGAPYFVRRDGVLEIVALHVAGGPETNNGKPYEVYVPSASERSLSIAHIIEGPVRDAILARSPGNVSVALQKPYYDPTVAPLPPVLAPGSPSDTNYNPYTFRVDRVIKPDPEQPRDEIVLNGLKLRDLTPDDQLLYGIPDEVQGVIVRSPGPEGGFAEGEVLLGETIASISKVQSKGIITKLTVYVRDTSGEIARRKLSMR